MTPTVLRISSHGEQRPRLAQTGLLSGPQRSLARGEMKQAGDPAWRTMWFLDYAWKFHGDCIYDRRFFESELTSMLVSSAGVGSGAPKLNRTFIHQKAILPG